MTICALERRGRHRALRNFPRQIIQMSYRWMLIPCTVKVAKERKARVKVKTKVTETDTTAKVKVSSQSNSDTLMGIAISVVNTDTRNQTVRVRTNSSMARVTSVEHMGTRMLTVLSKRWHTWNLNLRLNRMRSQLESSLWNGFTHWNMMWDDDRSHRFACSVTSR